jgi:trans-aconitate methyltransferase
MASPTGEPSPPEHRPRNLVFGEAAATYDATRPSYPAEVVDLLLAEGPSDAVDVGCGTGKAARLVAARHVAVLGLEPDARMAEVARGHGLRVEVTTVEDWTPVPCDLLYAAQAWHWVDPVVGAERAATALRPGGRWAAFWNDEDAGEVVATVHEVYGRVAPGLLEDRARHDDETLYRTVSEGIAATGCFGPVTTAVVPWTEELDVATFVARRSTHSSHRLLDPVHASTLHRELEAALGGPSTILTIPSSTLVLTATRS